MTKETAEVAGISYQKPEVILLNESGIGVAEYAARTCYDSFDASENEWVRNLNKEINDNQPMEWSKPLLGFNHIEHSDLLDQLAWTHFHHSILEHTNLSYLVRGTSRGVLQEQARHRIQAISVRSTRYTMSDVIYAYLASHVSADEIGTAKGLEWFMQKMLSFDMFVTTDEEYNRLEILNIFEKLEYQYQKINEFETLALAKDNLSLFTFCYQNGHFGEPDKLFEAFKQNKTKRNMGDSFKHIVSDNWKVDMVVTMNLRALKNYFTLRDSGAAYFQMQWLAQEMKKATPKKYLDLIVKDNKGK